MQRQLNLRHEGTHFDLRAIFDDLNERYFRRTSSRLQRHVGTAAKTSPQRKFHLWHNPGGRSHHSNQSGAGPAFRAALVFALRALSRDASFGRCRIDSCPRSRRRVHTPNEFNRREREFPATGARDAGKNEKSVALFALNCAVSALRSLASAYGGSDATRASSLRSF